MKKIRVGIIGIGNCFSGLMHGIEYYKKWKVLEANGLTHKFIGSYSVNDIIFVSAFDVDKNKIGKSLDKAAITSPNLVDWLKLPHSKVVVEESPAFDGVGEYVKELVKINKQKNINIIKKKIIKSLKETRTEILINYLPVGSQLATEFWASIAIEAKCAFINCVPVFIASNKMWGDRFTAAKLPLVGDDIKGQVGATIVHRVLTRLCSERGAKIENSYQLNVGGNTDFLNMKEAERLISKKISKTKSVVSQLKKPGEYNGDNFHIGPSDYISFLGNTKVAFIKIKGRLFADLPFSIDLKLEVDDKANSAGVVVDAIRLTKLALDRKLGGYMDFSTGFMKHPLEQKTDEESLLIVEKFINFL